MGTITVNGIVCRHTDYRENDRIITIYTQEMGRLDANARGAKKNKSPLLNATQPFVYGEFVLFFSKDKYTVNTAYVKESFYPLRSNLDRFAAGIHLLKMTSGGAQPGDANEKIFSLLYHSISFLSYTEVDPKDITLGFLLHYLDYHGYRPLIISCAQCGADLRQQNEFGFSSEAGGALCGLCAKDKFVSKLTLEAMRRILLLKDEELYKIKLGHNVKLELERILYPYAEYLFDRKIKPYTSY